MTRDPSVYIHLLRSSPSAALSSFRLTVLVQFQAFNTLQIDSPYSTRKMNTLQITSLFRCLEPTKYKRHGLNHPEGRKSNPAGNSTVGFPQMLGKVGGRVLYGYERIKQRHNAVH
jgi:hypothetical protein